MKNLTDKKVLLIGILVSLLLCVVMYFTNPLVMDVDLLPDQGASWYYWKLPVRDTFIMITAWLLFLIHLLGNYYLTLEYA